MLKAKNKI